MISLIHEYFDGPKYCAQDRTNSVDVHPGVVNKDAIVELARRQSAGGNPSRRSSLVIQRTYIILDGIFQNTDRLRNLLGGNNNTSSGNSSYNEEKILLAINTISLLQHSLLTLARL